MKTPRTFFRAFLLLTLLVAAGGNIAVAQTDSCVTNVIHTYMNGRLIPWDSVKIKVCEPPCERPYHYHTFMLYWPDTLLTNCTTGIEEYVSAQETELSQVFPNPCAGTSQVKLTLRNSGIVSVSVMDLQGRLCCQKTLQLSSGEHLLSLTLPQNGFYFVQAESPQGSEVCKVLCTEGAGSDFDIRLTSTSFQPIEKIENAGKGGEGLFNMTDKMQITAYITYTGEVRTWQWSINYDLELDGEVTSEWMSNIGSLNIHYTETDSCDNFTLSDRNFNVIIASSICLPTMEYPVGYRVTFYDSTFYSEPTSLAAYTSSTWYFNGWYKYRYYPEDLGGCICIGDINGEMPPEHIDYYGQLSPYDYCIRHLDKLTCNEFKLYKFTVYGNDDVEVFVSNE